MDEDEYDLTDDFIADEGEEDDGKWLEEIHRMTRNGKRANRPGTDAMGEEFEEEGDDDDDGAMEATTDEIREEEERSEKIGRLVDRIEQAREEGKEVTIKRITKSKQLHPLPVLSHPHPNPQPNPQPVAATWAVDLFAERK